MMTIDWFRDQLNEALTAIEAYPPGTSILNGDIGQAIEYLVNQRMNMTWIDDVEKLHASIYANLERIRLGPDVVGLKDHLNRILPVGSVGVTDEDAIRLFVDTIEEGLELAHESIEHGQKTHPLMGY